MSIETKLRSDKVKERVFTLENPIVIGWINKFYLDAQIDKMFEGINILIKHPSPELASSVGAAWLAFSGWVPKLLAEAAARSSDNYTRHFLVQILFEELGGRDREKIHSKLFEDSLKLIDIIDEVRYLQGNVCKPLYELLSEQLNIMSNVKSDSQIFGLNLGLEINAEENIETLFKSLAYSPELEEPLSNSLFFRIHRVVEEEHKRLNVSNFLRFCDTEAKKDDFFNGFNRSVKFWNEFWSFIVDLANKNLTGASYAPSVIEGVSCSGEGQLGTQS